MVFFSRTDRDYESWLNRQLSNSGEVFARELDIATYDKSQNEFALTLACEIMKMLNIDLHISEQWFQTHTINKIKYYAYGISFYTHYQRRSGEQGTYILNTIVGMCAFALEFDLDNEGLICGAFNGDDNIVFYKAGTKVRQTTLNYELAFNFSVKIDDYTDSYYFSSKFIVPYNNRLLYIADPFKLILKLGRHDLTCKEHITEYHRSLVDLYSRYKDIGISRAVADMAYLRYKPYYPDLTPFKMFKLCKFVAAMISDVKILYDLYDKNHKNWKKPLNMQFKKRLLNEFKYKAYMGDVRNFNAMLA